MTQVQRTPVFISCILGSFICWYDFIIFGMATAMVFSSVFFADQPFLIPLMVFAVGFAARILGGVIFGHYGDKFGRKNVLFFTLIITALATVGVGLLPSYAQIGIAAPILLICLRLIQGAAMGAEMAATSTVMFEYNQRSTNKGFLNSFLQTGLPLGTIASAAIFALVVSSFDKEVFLDWAWRIPFLLSSLLLIVGVYARMKLLETPEFELMCKQGRRLDNPVGTVIKDHWKKLIWSIGINQAGGVWNYTLTIWGFAYLVNTLSIPRPELTQTLSMVATGAVFLIVFYGWLGDRLGRANLYNIANVGGLILIIPVLTWLGQGEVLLPLLLGYAVVGKLMWAQAPTFFSELFPTEIRQSANGIIFGMTALIGGGVGPLVAQMLFDIDKNIMHVGYLLLAAGLWAVISGIALRKYVK